MAAYFHRCVQQAMDCMFQCHSDLVKYMLARKAMVGLCNPMLKREIFQNYSSYTSVECLRAKRLSFEAAERDTAFGGKRWPLGGAACVPDVGDTLSSVPPAAAASCWVTPLPPTSVM